MIRFSKIACVIIGTLYSMNVYAQDVAGVATDRNRIEAQKQFISIKNTLQEAKNDYESKIQNYNKLKTENEKYKSYFYELAGIGLLDNLNSNPKEILQNLKEQLDKVSKFQEIKEGEKEKVKELNELMTEINSSIFQNNDLLTLLKVYSKDDKQIDKDSVEAINHSLKQIQHAANDKIQKFLTDANIDKTSEIFQKYKDTYEKYTKAEKETEKIQETIKDFQRQLDELNKRLKDLGVFANAKNKQEQQVYEAMHNIGGKSDIPDQDIVEVADSLQEISNTSHKNTSTKISKLNSQLSTKTRLAKLSNPYNNNLAIAYAINNLKDEAFADSGDTLNSVFKEYTNRFNYDNNLWANVLGAKANLSSGQNAKMHGFSIGYDKAFDDTIVGTFATISKSKQTSNRLENRANNYEFGVYARQFLNSHEIDVKTSFGVSKNKLNRNVILTNSALRTNGRFTSKFVSFDLDYGYLFELGQSAFAKPNLGLSYLWLRNSQLKESGDLPVVVRSNNYKELSLNLGVEIRKYVADGSYFYLNPGFSQEIYKSQDDTVINFIGSNNKIIFDKDNDKKGYFTLQTGAEFSITTSLSTNINFGFKARDEEKYYTGTIGVRYKF
ncbi:hypothetical protein LMG7974_01330 [Campylobacter majalis]|uniref:Autotransporter domain-containing protein n=1 Tax=Campylobacter majalis TaxID=2790656 RepID=A0ABN7KC54_9BACT|nr:autotransporter outer membrane beta-barrel domain-containing protein [Campylobacter majalis]CAD7289075.1 hypothetical protein LMG7974_01330 [Campylobacter majalis]